MCSCKLLKPCCLSLSVCKLKNKVKRGKILLLLLLVVVVVLLLLVVDDQPSDSHYHSLFTAPSLFPDLSTSVPPTPSFSPSLRFTLSFFLPSYSSCPSYLFLSSPPSLYLYLYLPSSHLLSYIFHISLFFLTLTLFLYFLTLLPFNSLSLISFAFILFPSLSPVYLFSQPFASHSCSLSLCSFSPVLVLSLSLPPLVLFLSLSLLFFIFLCLSLSYYSFPSHFVIHTLLVIFHLTVTSILNISSFIFLLICIFFNFFSLL